MKKTIAVLSALISTAVFAGMDDLLISFYTLGPDKYADGTEVQVGECYSLVGTDAKGNTDIVLNYQTLTAGKCSPVVYMVDKKTASQYVEWSVYLTDTRDFANGGKPAGLDDKGQPKINHVQAPIVAAVATSDGAFATATATEGVSAGAYNLAAANVPQPKIEGIRVENAKVYVTVSNTRPFVGYALVYGDDVTKFSQPPSTGTNGDVSTDGVIELIADKKEGAQFFKVSTVK